MLDSARTALPAILLACLIAGCGARRKGPAVEGFVPAPEPRGTTAKHVPVESTTKSPTEEVARRYVSNFPGLASRRVDRPTSREIAELFANAPAEAFVYAKEDLDERNSKVTRGLFLESPHPRKGEPLLVQGPATPRAGEDVKVQVFTADGVTVEVALKWLLVQPESGVAIAASPRPVRPGMPVANVNVLLSTEVSQEEADVAEARINSRLQSTTDAYDKCSDRVRAKYQKRIDAGTSSVEQSGRTITVTSPQARMLEDQANADLVKTCGDRTALSDKYKASRKDAAAALYEQLAAGRARLFEKATARFRKAE